MNIPFLPRALQHTNRRVAAAPFLYPTLCTTRAASLARAIHRGIHRSKSVGFRRKERSREQDVGSTKSAKAGDAVVGFVRKHVGPHIPVNAAPMSYKGFKPASRTSSKHGRLLSSPKSSRESPNRIRVGRRIIKDVPERKGKGNSNRRNYSFFEEQNNVGSSSSHFLERRSNQDSDYAKFSGSYRGGTISNDSSKTRGTGKRLGTREWDADSSSFGQRHEHSFGERQDTGHGSYGDKRERSYDDGKTVARRSSYQPRVHEGRQKGFASGVSPRDDLSGNSRFSPSDIASDNDASPSRSPKIDKRIPISIPYTTPASEFLYGTSVVEAALRSKREPRRKLYKLYIYTGENRASAEQDAAIEKLARKNKVEVVRVAGDWLRLMDKMSNSRPHNGYILEASPLPKLPVTHLGEFNEENASEFEVALDHQSREEAAINGIDEVIKLSPDRFGRKPFVLFLDSILDPGNLGGMIRTAAFLGVTAVAISKNCASFSPVVLKASAGASEDITLFTVNKPAGFIANSKLAGWKIFAAVAPSGDRPKPMFIEKLDSPLIEDPCILMLGNEGEGLRENLRSKADAHITIRGSGRNLNVDSLNVSVATGILCNAFLKVSNAKRLFEGEQSSKAEGDLF